MVLFPYKPLDEARNEIRLLRLHPSRDPASSVICDLVHVSLNQAPPYEALSYTWGRPIFSERITLGGHDFIATENLKEALLALRQADTPRDLWVDAVCIDQEDQDEKAREVPRILDVYSTALRVLVWLGPADHDSGLAVDHLEALAREYDQRSSRGVIGVLVRDLGAAAASGCQVFSFFVAASLRSPQVITGVVLILVGRRFGHLSAYVSLPVIVLALLFILPVRVSVLCSLFCRWFGLSLATALRVARVLQSALLFTNMALACLSALRPAVTRWAQHDEERSRRSLAERDPGDGVTGAVAGLISRPWFSRSWTVQELVGAREAVVLCGGRTIHWSRFVRAFRTIDDRIVSAPRGVSPYAGCQSQHVKAFLDALDTKYLPPLFKERRQSLLRLIATFSDRDAGYNRDKVYAFLGMSNEGRGMRIARSWDQCPRLLPDYTRKGPETSAEFVKTDSEVYIETARFLIEATGSLDVLHAAGFFRSTVPSHPSWAPDWTPQRQHGDTVLASSFIYTADSSPFRSAYALADAAAKAEDGWVARFPCRPQAPCMVVRGFAVGHLRDVDFLGGGPIHVDFNDPWALIKKKLPPNILDMLTLAGKILSFFAACFHFTIQIASRNPLSRPVFARLGRWDPLGMGPAFMSLAHGPTSETRPLHEFRFFTKVIGSVPSPGRATTPPVVRGWQFDPARGFGHILPPSRIFSTYVLDARPGDLVVMLVGAKQPMIIRQREEEKEEEKEEDNVCLRDESGRGIEMFRHVGPGTFVHAIDRRAWSRIRDEHAEGRHPIQEFALV